MNAKSVLLKIANILNLSDDTPIQAKTADGKIFQSSNFDVNDDVFEVGADGKLTPAEDGEYTITFTTPEGKENTQTIDIDGGKVAEISTEAEEEQEETGAPEESGEETAINDETEMAKASVTDSVKDAEKVPAHALPNTTDEDPRNRIGPDTDDQKDPIISLSYKIDELEKALNEMKEKFASAFPSEGAEVSGLIPSGENMSAVEEDEEELPKLDGAPIDPMAKEQNSKNYGKKSADYQSSFLSKLYR